ncbi:MAG: VIT1/CCC1 transporter family protein [Chloroflexi bacterium]|nr:VIT1/CCC1 transporter family protein [Chloroflexota bacterium]
MTNLDITMTKTDRNLWNAIIGEAMALLKYNAYAIKALEEGHPEIAQIFQESAGAENIHGMNHLRTAGAIKSSLDNLVAVVQGEAKEINSRYPRMIREALDEGRRDAARAFTMAMDRERYHLESFMKATDDLRAKLERQPDEEHPVLVPSSSPQVATVEAPASVDGDGQHDVVHLTRVESEFPQAVREVETERWRVAASGRIREVVFGAQDGLVSTLALVTAVAAAVPDDKTLVVVAGLAGALAGMISMGTGTYLGSKAEKEVFQAEIEKEAKELEENPAEEMAELVFLYHQQGMSYHEAREMAEHIASDKELWLRTLVEKELGLDPDLVSNPIKDALTMGSTFIIAALIPIIPYFFLGGSRAIGISAGAALASLFVLGTAKGRLVQRSPILQGLEILTIGAAAAGIGWVLGEVIPKIVT